MNFETIQNTKIENKPSFYPERGFFNIEERVENLVKLEKGEKRKLELTENERQEVLEMEDKLGEKLEQAYDLKINSYVILPEFFLTNKGKEIFRSHAGFDIEGDTVEELQAFMLKKRSQISKIDGKSFSSLVGEARSAMDEEVFEQISQTMNENGEISIEGIKNPSRMTFIKNPENILKKIQKLRGLKRQIKEELSKLENDNENDLKLAKEKILHIYRKKINEMIAELYSGVVWADQLKKIVGESSMNEEEIQLAKQFPGISNFVASYAKLDKYLYGVCNGFDETGNARQISPALLDYVDNFEQKYIENELSKKELAAQKGLDYDKLRNSESFDSEKISTLANQYLELFGQKSSDSVEDFDPDRKGPASDGKWQFVPQKRFRKMSLSSKLKVIEAPIKSRSAEEVMSVVLGHEMTHVIQAFNQEKIPLRLFKKIMGDRRLIISEGGAMMVQDQVTSELFGYRKFPHVHYFRAMIEKLKGGTYLECAKASYESSLKVLKIRKEKGDITAEDFVQQAKGLLKSALGMAKGLFKVGESYDSKSSLLSRSNDLVYLEQFSLMEFLKKQNLQKYTFIRGLNLDTLSDLIEIGLVNTSDLKEPNIEFIKEVWQQEADKFKLAA